MKVSFKVSDIDYSSVFERKDLPLEDAIKELQRFKAKKENDTGKKKGRNSKTNQLFKSTSFDVSLGIGSNEKGKTKLEDQFKLKVTVEQEDDEEEEEMF
jgi:mannitol-specific phosphotransferase system IIBC component